MSTFANPVLSGCHPDPSVCRVGADYYLVTSTFEYWPGLPIFHSRDLVNWTPIGHAIDRPDQVDLSTVPSSGGLFAATIRHHDGLFFVTCTLVHGQGRRGNFVLTASDPAGPWSDPFWLDEAPGIDPSVFFDDDGRAWLTGTRLAEPGLWPGQTDVWLRELRIERDPVAITVVDEEHLVWRGALQGAVWAEGPHLYRVDGRYYLLAAEGGTEYDHAVSVAVADVVTGPYVGNPANPVLTHRHLGRSFSVTGVGHADLVEHTDGTWWAVALGSRPVGASGAQPLGRETFLVPVEWQGGWPVFAPGVGHIAARFEAPSVARPAVAEPGTARLSTRRISPALPAPWKFVRTTSESRAVFSSGPDAFDLVPRPVTLADVSAPTFVARRQQHHRAAFEATFTCWFDADTVAGLAVRQSESEWISLSIGPVAGPGPVHRENPVERSDDAGGFVHAGPDAGAVDLTLALTLTLTECRGGVEHILAQRSIRVPASVERPDPAVTVFVETCDGGYSFGARVSEARLPASPSSESAVHFADVDGTFLTSPFAGGFLGLWLGVFAFSRPAPARGAPTDPHGVVPVPPGAVPSSRPAVVHVSNVHYEPR